MFKTFLASTVLLASMTIFMACSDASTTPTTDGTSQHDGAITGKPGGGGTTPSNAVFLFNATRTINAAVLSTVSVSNADGSKRGYLYNSATSDLQTDFPTWSPGGVSVSFVEMPKPTTNSWYAMPWATYSIKAVDVASSGKTVTPSNVRTIFSASTNDSLRIVSQDWCPSATGAGAGKIAFMALGPTTSGIYLVSASGGPATKIYEVTNTDSRIRGRSLAWNSDGTKLAFVEYSGTSTPDADMEFAIRVIDVSGNIVGTYLLGTTNLVLCRWSPTNAGLLLYMMTPAAPGVATTDFTVYTLNTTSGAAPQLITTTRGTATPTWSPDGTEIGYTAAAGSEYRINITTGATFLIANNLPFKDWQ